MTHNIVSLLALKKDLSREVSIQELPCLILNKIKRIKRKLNEKKTFTKIREQKTEKI